MTGARIILDGIVQGVGFRWFTINIAQKYRVTGWVRNRLKGDVEIYAEAPKEILLKFIEEVKMGPRFGKVEYADIEWKEASGKFSDFTVKH